jgi:hypothetical protein
MVSDLLLILDQTATKLGALQTRLQPTTTRRPTDTEWDLLGHVKELEQRCKMLHDLREHSNRQLVAQLAELVTEVVAIEKRAGGSVVCELHPDVLATHLWDGEPVCSLCYDRQQEMTRRG